MEKWLFLWDCYIKKTKYDYILDEGMVDINKLLKLKLK